MVLTAPSCSFGCCVGPMAGPKGCGESGSPGLKHATAGLCLAPLSGKAFQPDCVASSRPGWHFRDGASCALPDTSPKNLPTAWAADGHYTQHGQTGPCSPPAYSPWGLPGSSCRKNPCLCTGARSSRSFWTGWGLSAAEEGREKLHTQSRAGNTKQGSIIPRQRSTGPMPSLGSCLGPGFQN